MPHSEETTTTKMGAQVNGEAPSSAFLSHLFSYPLISDSYSTFKSNPIGAKSVDFTTASYNKSLELTKPLHPYLTTPYSYVSPYVKKADSIGDSTLSTIDSKFPLVKKPTGELYDEGKAMVFFPLKKGTEGKEYVVGVFGSEKKKVGGEGIVTYGKAVVATGLVVSSDALSWLSAFLSKKKAEAKEVANEKMNN
ncbi:CAP20-like protein [Hyaloscypha hepaticicola]|uniref:CAP20-like protein n=1 Tax=Hyaloscypha hepaticicola TaxID=2082293 RepID=A0A2J6QJL0_9HELO|nr:CAP20-like protein [Hyaloscypha hepaticicola]